MSPKSKAPPAPRVTIEVDTSWLVQDERKSTRPSRPAQKAQRRPPPIPGAKANAPPPMPVDSPPSARPPPRMTMEVRAEWLEDITVGTAASEPPPSKRRSSINPAPKAQPPKSKRAPIPRED